MSLSNNSDNGLNSQVTISVGEKTFTTEELSAVFTEVRGKSQDIRASHERAILVGKEDIKRLSDSLFETVMPYAVISQNSKIYVDFVNRAGEKFVGIQDFLDANYRIPYRTSRINIDLVFLVRNTFGDGVHEFKIDIYIESGITVCRLEVDKGHNIDNFPFSLFDCRYFISFQNYALARNCATAIDDWLKTLPLNEGEDLHQVLYDWRRTIKFACHFTLMITLVIFILAIFRFLNIGGGTQSLFVTAIVLASVFTSYRIVNAASDQVQGFLRRLKPHSHIALTDGDRDCFAWYKKYKKKTLLWLILCVGASIFTNIVATFISDALKVIG